MEKPYNYYYSIESIQTVGSIIFPNRDTDRQSDAKQIWRNRGSVNSDFRINDEIYGGDKMIFNGKKNYTTFFSDGLFESIKTKDINSL